jgi:hypothetical protein
VVEISEIHTQFDITSLFLPITTRLATHDECRVGSMILAASIFSNSFLIRVRSFGLILLLSSLYTLANVS